MKAKIDFVTNSSCASFVVAKKVLSNIQIELIKNHIQASEMYNGIGEGYNKYDAWKITETENNIAGETSMDNFDMIHFLLQIGVDEEDIQHEGCY